MTQQTKAEQIRSLEFPRIMLARVASLPVVRQASSDHVAVRTAHPTHTVEYVTRKGALWVNVPCRVLTDSIICGKYTFSREDGTPLHHINGPLGKQRLLLSTLRKMA
jgi:hypothetical protein